MAQTKQNKLGKQLLALALDNLYAFVNDDVEEALDKALLRLENKSPDWRKQVRAYLWSMPKIRAKICEEGMRVYG